DHCDPVLLQEAMNGDKRLGVFESRPLARAVLTALIAAAGVEGVAQDRHDALALGAFQSRFQPSPLLGIDAAQHARIDDDEHEAVSLHFKKGATLPAGANGVFLPKPPCLIDIALDAVFGRRRQTAISL